MSAFSITEAYSRVSPDGRFPDNTKETEASQTTLHPYVESELGRQFARPGQAFMAPKHHRGRGELQNQQFSMIPLSQSAYKRAPPSP